MVSKDKEEKNSEPVQPSKQELDRLAMLAATKPGLMQYPHTAGGAPVVPTAEGLQKAHSLEAMQQQTGLQMDILSDFVKLAMSHAQKINARRIISRDIYDAKIRFTARIGHTYYLYAKVDDHSRKDKRVLSMIEPEAWGTTVGSPSLGKCLAKVKLLADHTWEVIEDYGLEPD